VRRHAVQPAPRSIIQQMNGQDLLQLRDIYCFHLQSCDSADPCTITSPHRLRRTCAAKRHSAALPAVGVVRNYQRALSHSTHVALASIDPVYCGLKEVPAERSHRCFKKSVRPKVSPQIPRHINKLYCSHEPVRGLSLFWRCHMESHSKSQVRKTVYWTASPVPLDSGEAYVIPVLFRRPGLDSTDPVFACSAS
jgi:hypothetical protein